MRYRNRRFRSKPDNRRNSAIYLFRYSDYNYGLLFSGSCWRDWFGGTTFEVIMKSDYLYESVNLTEQEIKEALLQAKRMKWFHEKHKMHWEEAESRIKKGLVKQLMK